MNKSNTVNPMMAPENKAFITFQAICGQSISTRKNDISFVRMVRNKKSPGYVVIVGMKLSAKDQHEFFPSREQAEEYLDSMESLLGKDLFYKYVNECGEICTIRKSAIVFIRKIKSINDRYDECVIIGLTDGAKDQHEMFTFSEEAEDFRITMLESI